MTRLQTRSDPLWIGIKPLFLHCSRSPVKSTHMVRLYRIITLAQLAEGYAFPAKAT